MTQKRIAAIHDISGLGKCSLTVALPIVSAAGIETAVIPTAVLSTHTGGFEGYTFHDLTDEIAPITEHWKKNNFQFDAIYTGYLGSNRQVGIVIDTIKTLKNENTKVICDPAMADHGKLYAGFDKKFPREMFKLCHNADIIVPNITEAVLMLGQDYKAGPYTKEYIGSLVLSLYEKTGAMVVLTGVYFDEKRLGAACFDGTKISYIMGEKIDAVFHGTGDVFASVLTAGVITGRSLVSATEIAVKFTYDCIKSTIDNTPERRYGVNFELCIPKLIKYLGIDYE